MSDCGADTTGDCGTGGHLCIAKGGTKNFTFYYRDKDGAGIDITGKQARFRLAVYDGANVLTLTSSPAAGLVITDASIGQVDGTLTPTQTGALTVGTKYEWQFELYDPLNAAWIKRFPVGTADVTDAVP